jgi:ribosomal protein S18 acetylase RimI-like enzyme
MTTASDLKHIARWVSKVRKQTSAGKEDVDADSMETVTEWLAQDFPVALFTPESAKLAAECANGYWPRWAVLRACLVEYQTQVAARSNQARIGNDISDSLRDHIEQLQGSPAHFARIASERVAIRQQWADPARVRASLWNIEANHPFREMLGRLLYRIVHRHAPQNLGLFPPDFIVPEKELVP